MHVRSVQGSTYVANTSETALALMDMDSLWCCDAGVLRICNTDQRCGIS